MIKIKPLLFGLIFSATLLSCSSSQSVSNGQPPQAANPSETAVLWQQTSAEYTALCLQAYNLATNRVKKVITGNLDGSTSLPKAVVMDLDETVLDNSPYNAKLILSGKEYDSYSWEQWVNLAQAEAVPGAKEFIEFATNNGIMIYYISNRDRSQLKPTLKNLGKLGIDASDANVLLKEPNLDKEQRRQLITEHEVIMLIGDNLADFDQYFEDDVELNRRKEGVKQFSQEFGEKFIILPNPMYGDWMKALDKKSKKREGKLMLLRSY